MNQKMHYNLPTSNAPIIKYCENKIKNFDKRDYGNADEMYNYLNDWIIQEVCSISENKITAYK